MKTKQEITVNIGGADVRAQHKSEMVNLNDLLKAGNEYRIKQGLKPYIDIAQLLRQRDVAEYCIIVEKDLRCQILNGAYSAYSNSMNDKVLNSNPVFNTELAFDQTGQAKLPTKDMASLRTRRGKYGGTWAHIDIAIYMGMRINPEFAHKVIKTFKEHQIFMRRDLGGDAWIRLTKAMHDHLEIDPRRDYGVVGWLIKKAIFPYVSKSTLQMKAVWNSPMATPENQLRRMDLCDQLTMLLEIEVITHLYQLKEMIPKLTKRIIK